MPKPAAAPPNPGPRPPTDILADLAKAHPELKAELIAARDEAWEWIDQNYNGLVQKLNYVRGIAFGETEGAE